MPWPLPSAGSPAPPHPERTSGLCRLHHLFIGAAGEVAVAGRYGMRPAHYHVGTAVGTEHKPGIFVLLFHLRRAASVLLYPLHDVPDLLGNESGMGGLKHQAFFSGMLHPPFFLVGLRAVLHVDGVSQIFRSPEDWQWHCQTRFCTPTFRQFCRKVSARRRHWELGVSPSKRVCHTNAVLAPTPPRATSPSAPVRTRN